jgi:septum formation protein
MKLVLASASPRRRMLLESIGVPIHAVRPAGIDESILPDEEPVAYAARMAAEKAAAVAAGIGEVVLAADTVVHLDGAVFGKPASRAEATATLTRLAGRTHAVTTGWCVRGPDAQVEVGAVTSQVRFRALGPAEVAAYAATGEGDDKAGGYGIQGRGAALVAAVDGDHANVVGLPLVAVLAALARHGVTPQPSEPA